jgi:hypothetical protein
MRCPWCHKKMVLRPKTKKIEDRIDDLALTVLVVGLLVALGCLWAAFSTDETETDARFRWFGIGIVAGVVGWVGRLLLRGYAKIVRGSRAKNSQK